MNSSQINSIIFFVILIMFSAFFSSSETAYTSVNRIRLKNEAEAGDKKAANALYLQENFDALLSTILIGNNLVNIASSAIATVFFVNLFPTYGPTIATAVTTLLLLLFGEIAPKLLAKFYSETLSKATAPFLQFLMTILKPLVWILGQWQKLVRRIIPMSGDDSISEEELLAIVDEARMGGSIEQEEHQLVRAAIEFDDIEISSILTPRVDVISFDLEDSDEEIADLYVQTPFSRLIVTNDETDEIVGTLHAKDFYRYLDAKQKNFTQKNNLKDYLVGPLFVPPNISPSDLLEAMQQEHTHVGIVVNEYGNMIGIATMEDVLEELVGEIWDESDIVRSDIIELEQPNTYLIQGTYALDKLFDLMDFRDDNDWLSSTVSGFITEQFERIPENNEVLQYKNLKFTIVNAQKQRVNEVIVESVPEE